MSNHFIIPDWPAPQNVKAAMTTRHGGYSLAPYGGFNLGDHVGDHPERVSRNRQKLVSDLSLPNNPLWLQQVHGIDVVAYQNGKSVGAADAIIGSQTGDVCAVMTADCLPVLFCNQQGTAIAAAHAGWRGLAAGVLEATIQAMKCRPDEIIVWLGAAIGPNKFEVGDEVRSIFIQKYPQTEDAFKCQPNNKWLADIYQLARTVITQSQIPMKSIYGGDYCTYQQVDDFYSYRRDSQTGRMASLLWLT